MLIQRAVLEGIAAGKIDLAFRRWRTPTVKAGGRLRTQIGELAIRAVEVVRASEISEREARRAGYASRAELLAALDARGGAPIHRIALRLGGPDPRIALRAKSRLTKEELAQVVRRLDRLDAASRRGAWTRVVLRLIASRPAVRAPDLAASLGRETLPFKADVRKLKELGLTESLDVGVPPRRAGARCCGGCRTEQSDLQPAQPAARGPALLRAPARRWRCVPRGACQSTGAAFPGRQTVPRCLRREGDELGSASRPHDRRAALRAGAPDAARATRPGPPPSPSRRPSSRRSGSFSGGRRPGSCGDTRWCRSPSTGRPGPTAGSTSRRAIA